jgi:hypothetical protein
MALETTSVSAQDVLHAQCVSFFFFLQFKLGPGICSMSSNCNVQSVLVRDLEY